MTDMILAIQISCMHWIQANNLEKEYLSFLCDTDKHKMVYSLLDFTIQYLESHADQVKENPDLDLYIAELDSF